MEHPAIFAFIGVAVMVFTVAIFLKILLLGVVKLHATLVRLERDAIGDFSMTVALFQFVVIWGIPALIALLIQS